MQISSVRKSAVRKKPTKLSSPGAVRCDTRPIIGPGLISVGAQRNHGLDGEAHAGLRLSYGLVLRIMWHVGCAVEQLVDAVPTVCLDNGAFLRLRVLLDDISIFTEKCAWLHHRNGLVQALSRCLYDADGVGICQCLLADVVSLVEITVEAAMVESYVDVEDVTVFEDALVGNAVANDFVGRGAHRLGEAAVVERRRIGLWRVSGVRC